MDPTTPVRTPSLLDPQLLWAIAALVATLLVGALIFAWLDRWRKRGNRDTLTPADQLTAFRQSYDRGEMSQEEYERIRTKLAPKVRQQYNVAPTKASGAANLPPSPLGGEGRGGGSTLTPHPNPPPQGGRGQDEAPPAPTTEPTPQ